MNAMKKFLLYSVYIIVVSIIFIYYLFPSDKVKEYIISRVGNANSDMSITISRISPAFPPGLNFHAVRLFQENSPLFEVEQVKVVPKILTIFREEVIFSFKGKSCGGDLEGKAILVKPDAKNKSGPRRITIDADLKGIHVSRIHAVKNQPNYKVLSGTLNAKIEYSNKEPVATAGTKCTISDFNIELLSPVSKIKFLERTLKKWFISPNFKLDEKFTFKNVSTEMAMEKNKKISIKQFDVKGLQISGNISGDVNLKTPFARSILRLTGNITLHPAFISSLAKVIPAAAILKQSGKKGIPFKIGGTVERPRY